jgi:hypothetical protein
MNSRIAGIAVLTSLYLVTPGFTNPNWVEVTDKDFNLPTLYSRMYGAYDSSSLVVQGNLRTVMTRTVFKSMPGSPTKIPDGGETIYEEIQYDCTSHTYKLLRRGMTLTNLFPEKRVVSQIDQEDREEIIINQLCGATR